MTVWVGGRFALMTWSSLAKCTSGSGPPNTRQYLSGERLKLPSDRDDEANGCQIGRPFIDATHTDKRRTEMISSVISRLNDRRDAAADLGEDAGFTLIELMVVLLILAILLAIAIPTFLGVTGGANDKAAQSNVNTALTSLKTAATQNNQTYGTPAASALSQAEPSLSFTTATIGTYAATLQGSAISMFTSADGNGIVLTAYSKSGNCWILADNTQAVTNSPISAT